MHYHSAMARNDPQLNLRLPAALKHQLEEAAKANKRTVTAETVARLQQTFADASGLSVSSTLVSSGSKNGLTADGGTIVKIDVNELAQNIATEVRRRLDKEFFTKMSTKFKEDP